MSTSTLVTHKGGNLVTESEVRRVATPDPSGRWFPVGHGKMVDLMYKHLEKANLAVTNRQFGLARNGDQLFCTFDVKGKGCISDGVGLSIGMRNSIDKSLCAGICFGSRVFVCDNLAFSGEVVFQRKHTTNILADLSDRIRDTIGRYPEFVKAQNRLFDALRAAPLKDEKRVHDFLIRAMDDEVIMSSSIKPILEEWRAPGSTFDKDPVQAKKIAKEFEDRTAWRLFNAFTARMRQDFAVNTVVGSTRMIGLTQMFDAEFATKSPRVVSLHIPIKTKG